MTPDEERRRALEAIAYGRAESAEQRRAAREALAELGAMDAVREQAAAPEPPPTTTRDEPAPRVDPTVAEVPTPDAGRGSIPTTPCGCGTGGSSCSSPVPSRSAR